MSIVVTTEWLRELVPTDLPAREIGERLSDIGLAVDVYTEIADGEARLELEGPTNRGDCWSIIGVARELAATLGLKVKLPLTKLRTSGAPAAKSVKVKVEASDLCPRYTARVIRGVKIGPSPDWMQRRLEGLGIRPISNVVDITNYVLAEWGQPLHAFDMDLLAGDKSKAIIVRHANAGEKLPLLDETTKELSTEDLVIATPGRAIALAGVMGGADTEIRDTTTDVLLESAEFNQISTRWTARRHAVTTESSVRFEHGVDPIGVELASQRAAYLLMKHAGGKVAPGIVGPNPKWKAPQITLRHSRVSRLLCGSSATIPDKDIRRTLKALGLELVREKKSKGDVVSVWRAPPWRRELAVEVDLIEEVGRIYGYDKLPGRPTMRVFPVTPHPIFEARRTARDVLTALGYTEVVGASFFTPERAGIVGGYEGFKIKNPARSDEKALRPSLVPSLLAAKRASQNAGEQNVRFFEVAPVCWQGQDGDDPRRELFALLDDGITSVDKSAEQVLLRAKGGIEALAEKYMPGVKVSFVKAPRKSGLASTCNVLCGDKAVGFAGTPSDSTLDLWDIKAAVPPAIVEIDLEKLIKAGKGVPQFEEFSRLPSIAREVALVMADRKLWAEIVTAATSKEFAYEWRSPPEFISVFGGKDAEKVLGTGMKCIAFRVVYRAADRTLTNDDVKDPHAKFVRNLCAVLAATVRG